MDALMTSVSQSATMAKATRWCGTSLKGGAISEYIGQDAEKLMTEYSSEFIRQFANTNSFMLDESVDSEGNIVMNMMQ